MSLPERRSAAHLERLCHVADEHMAIVVNADDRHRPSGEVNIRLKRQVANYGIVTDVELEAPISFVAVILTDWRW